MTKLFFDNLVAFEEIEVFIKDSASSEEEREELWKIVDEMVHQHVLTCILEKLPNEHHFAFLEKFYSCPYDAKLIDYLNEKIKDDVEKIIKEKINILEKEILKTIGVESG